MRWSLDQLSQVPRLGSNTKAMDQQHQQPQAGVITTRVLQVLEALDRHCFDRVDSSNNIDSLYSKIFQPVGAGSKGSPPEPATVETVALLAKKDEPLIRLLCQWAVSDQRYGEHRALAAAQLLEKRQADLVGLVENDSTGRDDNDAEESNTSSTPVVPQPVYQVCIFAFHGLYGHGFDLFWLLR